MLKSAYLTLTFCFSCAFSAPMPYSMKALYIIVSYISQINHSLILFYIMLCFTCIEIPNAVLFRAQMKSYEVIHSCMRVFSSLATWLVARDHLAAQHSPVLMSCCESMFCTSIRVIYSGKRRKDMLMWWRSLYRFESSLRFLLLKLVLPPSSKLYTQEERHVF